VVTVHISSGAHFSTGRLWWVSEAGRNYELRGNITIRGASLYIVDLATGTPTGGVHGSEDEPQL
jgi:hypothetical protein